MTSKIVSGQVKVWSMIDADCKTWLYWSVLQLVSAVLDIAHNSKMCLKYTGIYHDIIKPILIINGYVTSPATDISRFVAWFTQCQESKLNDTGKIGMCLAITKQQSANRGWSFGDILWIYSHDESIYILANYCDRLKVAPLMTKCCRTIWNTQKSDLSSEAPFTNMGYL